MKELSGLLDEDGKVKAWPKKQARKSAVLAYLATKFEDNRSYTEKEVNTILDNWHLFNDYFILRRGLIEAHLLSRDIYGREYRKVTEKAE